MHCEIISVGAFEVNCAIVWQEPSAAWVIDPGADPKQILDCLARHGLTVGVIVLTHGHIDHVSALDGLLARHPAPVYLHAADAAWAFSSRNRFPPYLHVPAKPADLHADLTDGQKLACGGLEALILLTPGHSPGCLCLHFEQAKRLFTGDTLFAGSVGRTDLSGGDARAQRRSLIHLLSLPDDLQIVAGHGPATTLAEERRSNPYLVPLSRAAT